MQYEFDRLNGNKQIDWVAEYSVAEGYYIASFNTQESIANNRFIEVKSFNNQPYFFWSRNEIDIARIKKNEYYLYLVDRDKLNDFGYAPIIIQNPYAEVLMNEDLWEQRVEKIRFSLKM